MKFANLVTAIVVSILFSFGAQASKVKTTPLSRSEIEHVLIGQGMDQRQVDAILRAIAHIEQRQNTNLEINGMLQASYFNASLFHDKDTLNFDTVIKDEGSNKVVKLPKLVSAQYTNHGIKIELGYKWVLVFMTNGLSLKALNTADCGPGLALGLPVLGLLGLEGGYMPCKNVPGAAIVISPIIGAMGSLTFPHLKFKVNEVAQ